MLYTIGGVTYQNGQKYSECQLVAALNAAYHLGEELINPNSSEYERLVDFTGGRHGSCICIDQAYKYLRLRYLDVKPSFESIYFSTWNHFPIQIGIHHVGTYGFHSTLVIGLKCNDERGYYDLRIPNFRRHTNEDMWIHWKDYEKLICVKKNIKPERGFFRIFYKEPIYTQRWKEKTNEYSVH